MAKITLDGIVSGFKSVAKIISNFDSIEDNLNNKVLYRDNPEGEPNQMENELDMNSNRILNLPTATSATEPVTFGQFTSPSSGVSFAATVVENQMGSEAAGNVFTLSVTSYVPGLQNLSVYINGVRQLNSTYAETNNTQITFNTAPVATDEYTFVVNETNVDTDFYRDAGGRSLVESFVATEGQTVITLTNTYTQYINNVSVYRNGVRQSAFEETSASSITLTNPASAGDELVVIINEAFVIQGTSEAANVVYTPQGVGAVNTTVQAKLQQTVSVEDYGAVGDGVTDDTAAFNAAFAASKVVYGSSGKTYVVGDVTPPSASEFHGNGCEIRPPAGASTIFKRTGGGRGFSLLNMTLTDPDRNCMTSTTVSSSAVSTSATSVQVGDTAGFEAGQVIVIVSDDTLDGKARVHISKISSVSAPTISFLEPFEWSGAAIGNTVLTSEGLVHVDGPITYRMHDLRLTNFGLGFHISGKNSGSIKSKRGSFSNISFETFDIGAIAALDSVALNHYHDMWGYGNSPNAWRSGFGFYNDNTTDAGAATVEGGDHDLVNVNFLSIQHGFLLSKTRGMKGLTVIADNCRGAAWKVRNSSTENLIVNGLAGISEYGVDIEGNSDININGFRSRNTGSFSSGYDIRAEDGSTLFLDDLGFQGTRVIYDAVGYSQYNVVNGRHNKRPHSHYVNSYSLNTVSAGSTVYLTQAGEQATNVGTFIAPYACHSVRMKVQGGGTPGTGETYTYTLQKGGSDTALVATIGESDSNAEAMDQRVFFQEGDQISVKLETSGGATARRHRVLVEFE